MPLDRLLDRFIDAVTSPERRDRTVVASLVGYSFVWTLYGVFAKGGQDISVDTAELVDWSQHFALGYANFRQPTGPVTSSAIGLWLAWQLYREYLDPEKQAAGLALLTFVPIYNFFVLKFNVDVALPQLASATMRGRP